MRETKYSARAQRVTLRTAWSPWQLRGTPFQQTRTGVRDFPTASAQARAAFREMGLFYRTKVVSSAPVRVFFFFFLTQCLCMWLSLALNLQQCSSLKLHIAGMTGKGHHIPLCPHSVGKQPDAWFCALLCRALPDPYPSRPASSCHQESPTQASGRFHGSPSLGRLYLSSDALHGVANSASLVVLEAGCGGASWYQQKGDGGRISSTSTLAILDCLLATVFNFQRLCV